MELKDFPVPLRSPSVVQTGDLKEKLNLTGAKATIEKATSLRSPSQIIFGPLPCCVSPRVALFMWLHAVLGGVHPCRVSTAGDPVTVSVQRSLCPIFVG
jgi:hypothetical protein